MKKIILAIILMVSSKSYACSCVDNYKTPEEIYSTAVALHSTVVDKTTVVSSKNGRATLEVRFKVLSTIKGSEVEYLKGNISIPFPTIDDGKFVSSGTSCDTNYSIGQEVFIALYKIDTLRLGFCSENVLMPGNEYWRLLIERRNANKLLKHRSGA